MNGLAAEVTASAATVQQAVDLPAALDKFHTFYSTAFEHLLSTFSTGVMWVIGLLALVGVMIPIISAWRQNAREAEFDRKLAASEKGIGTIRDQLLTRIEAREAEFERNLAATEAENAKIRDEFLTMIAEVERAAESAAKTRIADLEARIAAAEVDAKSELDRQVCYLKSFTLAARSESMANAGNHPEAALSAAAAIREVVISSRPELLTDLIPLLRQAAAKCRNPKVELGGRVVESLNKALANLAKQPDGGGVRADLVRDVLEYTQGRLKEP